jgi:hypothetical protein
MGRLSDLQIYRECMELEHSKILRNKQEAIESQTRIIEEKNSTVNILFISD